MSLPESAREFLAGQVQRVRRFKKKKRLVFPEGNDMRVVVAASRLAQEDLVAPILVGKPMNGVPQGIEFVDPATAPKAGRYADVYFERRRSRGVTQMEAAQVTKRPLYFAALMVAAGDADGFVGGAVNSTAETARAALHCIGTLPTVKTVSTVMFLCVRDQSYGHRGVLGMADPALVVRPTAVQLAEIAITSAESVQTLLDVEPAVAILSFSTKGSAKHPEVERIREAHRIVQARAPDLHVDSELQADAALVEAVGRSKAPGSTVAGKANTMIFPDLNAANIGVKLVERLGGAVAYGPFLQGLWRPANDLSRGCSPEEVYGTAIVTALQAEHASPS